ncbi:MAG: response regulator [Bacteroidota bacterium]
MAKRKTRPDVEKVTVLVVEDSEEFSNLLLYILEDKGYAGVRLPRENEFMEWVQKEQPVAILMDLALLHRDGFELLHELWADPKWRSTPVVVITGRDLDLKEQMLLQEHAAVYLRKGRVPTLELHKAIQETVERAKASRKVKP